MTLHSLKIRNINKLKIRFATTPLKRRKEIFARATGVKLEIFYEVLAKARPFWDKLQRAKLCHGRNSNLKSLENEFLLVLFYYRCYISHFMLGMHFGLDASNVCRHLKVMEPLIAKAIHIKKNKILSAEELEKILIDATEIQTQRPTKRQRKFYSGKKKKHTQKIEIMVSNTGKILGISKAYPGRVHEQVKVILRTKEVKNVSGGGPI